MKISLPQINNFYRRRKPVIVLIDRLRTASTGIIGPDSAALTVHRPIDDRQVAAVAFSNFLLAFVNPHANMGHATAVYDSAGSHFPSPPGPSV
jgi:hypothetical protein